MQRRLEVMETSGAFSRITITPERITVKIRTAHADMTKTWMEAAEAIASQLDFSRSLRGKLDPERPEIRLETDNSKSASYRSFLFNFSGEEVSR